MLASKVKMSKMRRKNRVRSAIKNERNPKIRLSVHKSNQHLYAQLIDDTKNVTLACASTLDKDVRSKLKSTCNIEAAKAVGSLVAKRALKAGIESVVYDRSGFLYHGRIKALADAAREAGLKF